MNSRSLGWRAFKGVLVAAALWTFTPTTASAAETGEELFNKVCKACHTVGGGKLVGPDLKGVTERRSEEWLLRFIKSSQTVVKSGDADAVKLFEENNKIMMPDTAYSDEQIKLVLAYIGGGGGGSGGAAPAAPIAVDASVDNIEVGRNIFQGRQRLTNGGPSCNSCHHVQNDAVIGGGILAKDLTQVFGRMGAPGVQAILGAAPFPVMEQAYRDHPVTTEEMGALIAFLQDADANAAFQQPRDYGFKLFYSGVAGLAVLLGLYGFIWRGRKRMSVNSEIYARQVDSQ